VVDDRRNFLRYLGASGLHQCTTDESWNSGR
jgi:hypothetical protein